MKSISKLVGVVLLLGFSTQGLSQERGLNLNEFEAVQNKIELVISDQIKAFARLDVDGAYFHASQSIKSIFPNSETFGAMVKNSYPMIWAAKEYKFLKTSYISGSVVQKVMFTDSGGGIHFFDYALKNTGKRWVISGVYMVKGEEGA